jgi:hypothetical protein
MAIDTKDVYTVIDNIHITDIAVNGDKGITLDPEIGMIAQPWAGKALRLVFSNLCEQVRRSLPRMQGAAATTVLEYTIATMIKSWGEHQTRRMEWKEYNKIPTISLGAPPPLTISLGAPPPPTTCCICGEDKCAHLQTLLADYKDMEVINVLLKDVGDGEGLDIPPNERIHEK